MDPLFELVSAGFWTLRGQRQACPSDERVSTQKEAVLSLFPTLVSKIIQIREPQQIFRQLHRNLKKVQGEGP